MPIKSPPLFRPSKAGPHLFQTLIQISPKTPFAWPVIIPVPPDYRSASMETVLSGHSFACRIVTQLTRELLSLSSRAMVKNTDLRRPNAHVLQISMYICHVVLRMSLSEIGQAFGKHRTTVSYACHTVEDRRDDASYDQFVSTVERIVLSIFNPGEDMSDA
jgi:hypothetical protein